MAVFLLVLSWWLASSLVHAQDDGPTATTTENAPVFGSANDRQQPVRIARQGSVLLLLEEQGDWCRVEYQDPDVGRRVGYVQRRFVRIDRSTPVPERARDVSASQRPAAVTPPSSFGRLAQQRGDVTVGYNFVHFDGVDMPLGLAVTDAWRIGRSNADFVIESQYARGTIDAIAFQLGASVFTGMAGVRGWTSSRYGDQVGAFGQVLVGFETEKAALGSLVSASTTGFAIQPGLGVEIPVGRTVAIRPQVDLLFGNFDSGWDRATRFNVNAVFRLFAH